MIILLIFIFAGDTFLPEYENKWMDDLVNVAYLKEKEKAGCLLGGECNWDDSWPWGDDTW